MSDTRRPPFSQLPFSQPALIIIEEQDRKIDGNYEIGGIATLSFVFEIPVDGQLKVNSRQLGEQRQSYTMRIWVSKDPNDIQLFNHFHPTSGGIHHLFVDETLNPLPEPEVFQVQRNEFSGFSFAVGEELVPLPAGIYHYNVHNMEGLDGGFFVNFKNPGIF